MIWNANDRSIKAPTSKGIMRLVKSLEKALRGFKTLVFLDLEGTQFSHEVTEIGAYKVFINDDFTVKKISRPFRCYVKAKGPVGPLVSQMTSITDELLKKEGIPFRMAQQALRKFVGREWFNCLFITYGNQDVSMMLNSLKCNPDAFVEDVKTFRNRNLDFCAFLADYIRDQKGNVLSLSHACEALQSSFEGKAHDALTDAKNLISLYSSFIERKDLIKESYLRLIQQGKANSSSVKKAAQYLASGRDVTSKQFQAWIEEELN